MSTSVELPESRDVPELPLAKPLDEARWQAWVLKGRTQDTRRYAAVMNAVRWISLAALLLAAAAGLRPQLTPYDIVFRVIVAPSAIVLMFQSFHGRHYALGVLFGALALLYNPVSPVFRFSGEWRIALLIASTLPFVASLNWPSREVVPHE